MKALVWDGSWMWFVRFGKFSKRREAGGSAAVIASAGDAIHCHRVKKAKNGLLRRFAPRNDVPLQICVRSLAARCARAMQGRCPRKEEGAGNAGCPLHPQPRVQIKKHTSVVTTGSPE